MHSYTSLCLLFLASFFTSMGNNGRQYRTECNADASSIYQLQIKGPVLVCLLELLVYGRLRRFEPGHRKKGGTPIDGLFTLSLALQSKFFLLSLLKKTGFTSIPHDLAATDLFHFSTLQVLGSLCTSLKPKLRCT